MALHLAIELPWHDAGWNGRVCQRPAANRCCHEGLADPDTFNLGVEQQNANQHWDGTARSRGKRLYRLPCIQHVNTFGLDHLPYRPRLPHSLRPGQAGRNSSAVKFPNADVVQLPARSVMACPVRWLTALTPRERRDKRQGRWLGDPAHQRELLDDFWSPIEPGQSVVVFYCRSHPWQAVTGPDRAILVGVSQVEAVTDLGDHKSTRLPVPYPIWERVLAHGWPWQGMRIPWHQFSSAELRQTLNICSVPLSESALAGDSCRHIGASAARECMDKLLATWEALRGSLQHSPDGASLCGNVDWLEHHRPAAGEPSTGANWLRALGVTQPFRAASALAGEPGRKWAEHPEVERAARGRGSAEKSLARIALAELLSPLDRDVRNCADLLWRTSSQNIQNTLEEIESNPFLLAEATAAASRGQVYRATDIANWVRRAGRLPDDKPEFLRAVLCESVTKQRSEAHAWWTAPELVLRSDNSAALGSALQALQAGTAETDAYYRERVWWENHQDDLHVGLASDRQEAIALVKRLTELARMTPDETLTKEVARCYQDPIHLQSRLLCVTGPPGSGKSTRIANAIAMLSRRVSSDELAVLTPTGRAAMLLRAELARQGVWVDGSLRIETVDRFLTSTGNTRLKKHGGKLLRYLIIDEASMLPVSSLARLLSSLFLPALELVTLVGDPEQLPPIGIGAPFKSWLEYANGRDVVHLDASHRLTKGSRSHRLAQAVANSDDAAAHKVLASRTPRTADDLRIVEWRSQEELIQLLGQFYSESGIGGEHHAGQTSDRQLICARRRGYLGSNHLNRVLLRQCRQAVHLGIRMPTDDLQRSSLAWKVIQRVNRQRRYVTADEQNERTRMVPNGALGRLTGYRGMSGRHRVEFIDFPGGYFEYTAREVKQELEPGLVCTTHRVQGSTFEHTGLIVSRADTLVQTDLLSRELLYTALTRHRGSLTILAQKTGPRTHAFLDWLADARQGRGLQHRRCFLGQLLRSFQRSGSKHQQ